MNRRLVLTSLFLGAFILRFMFFGYSDYQGDEIKALYYPKEASSVQFFLDQRKGPAQFLVTGILKFASDDYHNRLLVRLPFAIAGFLAVVVFYYLVKELFSERVAIYATLFFATNGFLIAFSRLVQYQSLVIFFGLLATYLSVRYVKSGKFHFLVLAGISWSGAMLAHYDGIFFAPMLITPLAVKVLSGLKARNYLPARQVGTALLMVVLITGIFYIPFVLNLSQSTADYWTGRITGEISSKISSSRHIFSVYQPIYVIHAYTLLGLVGIILVMIVTVNKLVNFKLNGIIKLFPFIPDIIAFHIPFSVVDFAALLLWFFIPFLFLELIVSIPGTHIYSYIIPLTVLIGFALFHIEFIAYKINKYLHALYMVLVLLFALFLFLQSFYVFVDHIPEYPWSEKKFLVWTLPKPAQVFHLSLFGFPYYRHWDEVSEFVNTKSYSDYYTTNERVTISRYYINLIKDGNKAGYFIHIIDPQSFIPTTENAAIIDFVAVNDPVKTFYNRSKAVTKIYIVQRP